MPFFFDNFCQLLELLLLCIGEHEGEVAVLSAKHWDHWSSEALSV